IEGLIQEQAAERDRKRREAILHRIQQLIYERVTIAPIWEIAVLNAWGPRVAEPGLSLIPAHLFTAPYEEVMLKARRSKRSPRRIRAATYPGKPGDSITCVA